MSDFLDLINDREQIHENQTTHEKSLKRGKLTDAECFAIIDEETGKRFAIPMLSTTSGDYYYSYVYYMRLRERSPETFAKLINWG